MVGLTREQRAARSAALAQAQAAEQQQEHPMQEQQHDPARPPEEVARAAAAIRPPLRSASKQHASVRDAASVARALREDRVTADEGHDKFFIDPDVIPDGWTYMWRRKSVAGKDDIQYQNGLARRGWAPVPQDRHPDIEVEQDGLILMELPTSIVEEQRRKDERMARMQVASKEAQLVGETPEGHLPRTAIRGQKPITKTFEAHQPIPD